MVITFLLSSLTNLWGSLTLSEIYSLCASALTSQPSVITQLPVNPAPDLVPRFQPSYPIYHFHVMYQKPLKLTLLTSNMFPHIPACSFSKLFYVQSCQHSVRPAVQAKTLETFLTLLSPDPNYLQGVDCAVEINLVSVMFAPFPPVQSWSKPSLFLNTLQ